MSTTVENGPAAFEKGRTANETLECVGATRLCGYLISNQWPLTWCVPVITIDALRNPLKFNAACPAAAVGQRELQESGKLEIWIRAQVQGMRERGEKIDNNNHGFCIHPECTKPNKGKPLHIMSRVHHIRQKPAHASDVRTMTGRKGGKPRPRSSNSDNVSKPSQAPNV